MNSLVVGLCTTLICLGFTHSIWRLNRTKEMFFVVIRWAYDPAINNDEMIKRETIYRRHSLGEITWAWWRTPESFYPEVFGGGK